MHLLFEPTVLTGDRLEEVPLSHFSEVCHTLMDG